MLNKYELTPPPPHRHSNTNSNKLIFNQFTSNQPMIAQPTIVTAYYKLSLSVQSRDSYKAKRTTQTYLDYFSFWARVSNTFIIYTSEDIDEAIYSIRGRYGLRDKTIVIHKSLESFDPCALDSIRKVFMDYNQSSNRFDPYHPPHTSPEYNYLMYCKTFFICDAFTNPLTQSQNLDRILWLDFGYNLGGSTYTCSEEFDFPLIPRSILQDSKLNLFQLGTPDTRTLPHILIHGTNHFITGGCMYGGKSAWIRFNSHVKEALKAFISFNIIDDDQKLLIWCVRNYPDDFYLHDINDWFYAISYFMSESKHESITKAELKNKEISKHTRLFYKLQKLLKRF